MYQHIRVQLKSNFHNVLNSYISCVILLLIVRSFFIHLLLSIHFVRLEFILRTLLGARSDNPWTSFAVVKSKSLTLPLPPEEKQGQQFPIPVYVINYILVKDGNRQKCTYRHCNFHFKYTCIQTTPRSASLPPPPKKKKEDRHGMIIAFVSLI